MIFHVLIRVVPPPVEIELAGITSVNGRKSGGTSDDPMQASSVVDEDAATTEAPSTTGRETTPKNRRQRTQRRRPEHFRVYVSRKLARLERFDPTIFHFDVELQHERNAERPRVASESRSRPAARGRSPAPKRARTVLRGIRIRDCQAGKRCAAPRTAERSTTGRRRRYRSRKPPQHSRKMIRSRSTVISPSTARRRRSGADRAHQGPLRLADDGRRRAVRDGAGRPRLLPFHDKETDRPSVVYRRHAFDYGLIRLADVAAGRSTRPTVNTHNMGSGWGNPTSAGSRLSCICHRYRTLEPDTWIEDEEDRAVTVAIEAAPCR